MVSYYPSNIPTLLPSQMPSKQPYPLPTIETYQNNNSLSYYIYFTFLLISIFTILCVSKICLKVINNRIFFFQEYCKKPEGTIEIELKNIQFDESNIVNKNHNIKFNIT